MKKILIPLIALAIVSCAKEENRSDASYNGPTQTIEIKTIYNDGTKAVYTDGQGMSWTSADATELGLLCGSSWDQATSTAIAVGTSDATFTASVPVGTTSFAAYYPASSVSSVSGSTVNFTIPSEQTQSAAGASDDKKIMLVSKSVTQSGTAFTANMKPAAALVRFVLYSTDETLRAKSVSSVTLKSADNIAGSLACDLSAGTATLTGSAKTVTVTLGTAYALTDASSKDAAGTKGIYAQVAPGSVITGFSVAANSSPVTGKEFTFSTPKTITGGGITNIFVDLAKGEAYVTVSDVTTLQTIIDACTSGTTVRVGAGTFTGTITLKDGVNISGGWNSTFTTCDPSTNETVLDGNNAAVTLTQSASFTNKTTISGLTIKNGKNTNTTSNGGCVSLRAGVVLDNCKVTGGSANNGAGVYVLGASTIQNCKITGNTATGNGGGIYCENNSIINKCIVSGNTAKNGGGIEIKSTGFPGIFLSNTLIRGNTVTAMSGSGLHMYASYARPITVYNCTVADNVNDAAGDNAYGVYCSDKHIWFVNNIVYGNTTSGDATGKKQVYMNCGQTDYTDGPYLYNNAVTTNGISYKPSALYTASGNIDLSTAPYGSDYKLTTSSCINKGLATFDAGTVSTTHKDANNNTILDAGSLTLTSTDLDLAGNSRVQGTAPDLGCYEKE
jgi:predicted outer membrane repeat protein